MSSESARESADRWRQVFAGAADRPATYCRGCGSYRVVHSAHRADCTAQTTAEHGGEERNPSTWATNREPRSAHPPSHRHRRAKTRR